MSGSTQPRKRSATCSRQALGNLVDEERFRNGVRTADAGRDSQTDGK